MINHSVRTHKILSFSPKDHTVVLDLCYTIKYKALDLFGYIEVYRTETSQHTGMLLSGNLLQLKRPPFGVLGHRRASSIHRVVPGGRADHPQPPRPQTRHTERLLALSSVQVRVCHVTVIIRSSSSQCHKHCQIP